MDTPFYFFSVSGNDIGDGSAIQFAAVPQLLSETSVDNETLHNDLVSLHNDLNILIGTILIIVTMFFVMKIRSSLFPRRKK